MTRLLSDALDRSLTIGEHLQVRVHLPTCSGCREYRKHLKTLRDAARIASGREVGDEAGEE